MDSNNSDYKTIKINKEDFEKIRNIFNSIGINVEPQESDKTIDQLEPIDFDEPTDFNESIDPENNLFLSDKNNELNSEEHINSSEIMPNDIDNTSDEIILDNRVEEELDLESDNDEIIVENPKNSVIIPNPSDSEDICDTYQNTQNMNKQYSLENINLKNQIFGKKQENEIINKKLAEIISQHTYEQTLKQISTQIPKDSSLKQPSKIHQNNQRKTFQNLIKLIKK